MQSGPLLRILAVCGLVLAGSVAAEAHQPSARLKAKFGKGIGTFSLDAAAPATRLRYIVVLTDPAPDAADRRDRKTRIADGQNRVLAGILGLRSADEPTRKVRRYATLPLVALEANPAELERLAADATVAAIQPDEAVQPLLDTSTQLTGARAAWTLGATGSNQAVAVLDTGVKTSHPFFAPKIIDQACFSGGGGVATTLCPNGQYTQTGIGAAETCAASVSSACFHGTHVSGIAVGLGGKTGSRDGVAHFARLVPVQVFSRSGNSLGAWFSDIVAALDWVNNVRDGYDTVKIAAVNMSIGDSVAHANCDSDLPAVKTAIDTLRANGIATVIAAGNNGFTTGVSAPGCISTAITVGATTKKDGLASFSNVGDMVDLYATGVDIQSSILSGYGKASGTSMAAPHVAGAFAALRSAVPGATVDAIEAALENSGRAITASGVTAPRIRIDSAKTILTTVSPAATIPPVTDPATLVVSPTDGWTVTRLTSADYSMTAKSYTVLGANGDVGYTITAGGAGIPKWLKVSATAGTATDPAAAITISVNEAVAAKLNNGTYKATLTFTNTTNNVGTTTRLVTFVRK
ncbi:S8 family peptidase [Prosthecomicrobium hirschii]|uniref:S8 family peptidase n=1 Tax=Prosthecodimorpha hirschii TaxID=665126 RepID=UPI001364BD98|nr:S8 family serine peptidase [Prosthecomicrobium hirschii]